jgi:hypothetical protein
VIDHIQWIILGAFALIFLLLSQSRELMRQVGRTTQEWHRMRAAFQQRRDDHRADNKASQPCPGGGDESKRGGGASPPHHE